MSPRVYPGVALRCNHACCCVAPSFEDLQSWRDEQNLIEERSHTRPVAAAAQTRHDIAEALAAAGETRTTGKATAQQNRGR